MNTIKAILKSLKIPLSVAYKSKVILNKLIKSIFGLLQILLVPFTLITILWFRLIMKRNLSGVSDWMFGKLGVLPVLDHYYQPLVNPRKHIKHSLREPRILPGIDWNVDKQLELMSKFSYQEELKSFPMIKSTYDKSFYYENGSYMSGDAEYLYNIIRHFKPGKVIEVGSGNSTLMARNAIEANIKDDSSYNCSHVCIEPYEQPWLEAFDIELIREKVEDLGFSVFEALGENDILFIDSSHVIRPQGDVLFEFLEILPRLKKGVIIHVHDVFSPRDYLDKWIFEDHLMWNEQYLLEAFLSHNNQFEIIGALNFLTHEHPKEIGACCPVLAGQPGREPGAFWFMKTT